MKNKLTNRFLKRILFCVIMLCGVPSMTMGKPLSVNDSLLQVYMSEIKRSNEYLSVRQQRIDTLLEQRRNQWSSWKDLYRVNCLLAAEYRPYRCKEALRYYQMNVQLAREVGNRDCLAESLTDLAYLLASAGVYHEAFSTIALVDTASLSEQARVAYYRCMYHLHGEAGFYGGLETYMEEHREQRDRYFQLIMENIPDTGVLYLSLRESYAREHLDADVAMMYNRILLQSVRPGSPEYALYAYCRSDIYRFMNKEDEQLEWLLRSALDDVRNGITDNGSSWMVAEILYHRGDIQSSYEIIHYSLANASFYDASLRIWQISPLVNIISTSYLVHQRELNSRLVWALACSILLALLLMLAILLYVKRTRRIHLQSREIEILSNDLRKANEQLQRTNYALLESNHVKDEYIGHYLNLYSDYLDKLRKQVKDPAFTQSEIDRFYREFDTAFLSIYPDFVANFNQLLREEGRIVLRKGDLLNTELRIYALIRLGIDNSVNISRLLRYSVNTIYNYRARLKNLAIDRDAFESQVQQIGTFTK